MNIYNKPMTKFEYERTMCDALVIQKLLSRIFHFRLKFRISYYTGHLIDIALVFTKAIVY